MLTISTQGGLGNQLFMLASAEGIAYKSGRSFYFDSTTNIKNNPHSSTIYANTLLKKWSMFKRPLVDNITLYENKFMTYVEWADVFRKRSEANIKLHGYFQRWEYIHPIRNSFIQRLSFNEHILSKYPDIQNCMFVHIRGGDYIGSNLHHVDLIKYYNTCLDKVHPTALALFTNDKPYAMKILEGRSFTIIDENEEDSLYLMSKCKGGIMGNSTFAWWGAYLNPNRQIFMPSKWFLDPNFDSTGYFFPGATVVEV